VSMVLGLILCYFIGAALMGEGKQGFQYIQEYTGFVSPGIFAIFILGFFWKRTTAAAALVAAVITFPLSLFLKFLPKWADLSSLAPMGFASLSAESGVYEIPFLDRMGFVFLICAFLMIVISLLGPRENEKGLEIDAAMFKPQGGFAVGAVIVFGILAALYTMFW
jgi:SSS family solute:Na+ symporter